MDFDKLHELISNEEKNVCQVVGYKNGIKVYSDTWNGYKESDACHVMSVTKSIVSVLIGIAIDNGFIKSVDQYVLDFFPEYKIKRGEKTIQKVTIKNLLTMTAPYKCKCDPWTKVCSSSNWTYTSLDFLGGRKGITNEFNYQTVCIHILSGILFEATKMKTVDFANEYLFKPLNIISHRNYLAMTAEEHKKFTISKEPKENVWFCDPQGLGTPGYGLCFSAYDMSKIGQMCLNNGIYNGIQVVSSNWILESTKTHYKCDEHFQNMAYGYLWWIIDEKNGIYSAIGNSGNVIYINSSKNIVVSITSTFKPTVLYRIQFIRKYIEPYIESI